MDKRKLTLRKAAVFILKIPLLSQIVLKFLNHHQRTLKFSLKTILCIDHTFLPLYQYKNLFNISKKIVKVIQHNQTMKPKNFN